MNIQDFKNHVQKVRDGMAVLCHKAKGETEYRRLGILAVVLLVSTTVMSPLIGIALVLFGVWYLTY
ncbi:hypothetical protein PDESU_02436 [Pontiella desulfatans]|uniref:Uncharacterized protein n=2 Tax=Pontiella desulfatans TaxID=2750659 RepID=A0A6C2U263_PONDE|nr:hypothetical protein PDESU_02436 [Pontiella desulfatans]